MQDFVGGGSFLFVCFHTKNVLFYRNFIDFERIMNGMNARVVGRGGVPIRNMEMPPTLPPRRFEILLIWAKKVQIPSFLEQQKFLPDKNVWILLLTDVLSVKLTFKESRVDSPWKFERVFYKNVFTLKPNYPKIFRMNY